MATVQRHKETPAFPRIYRTSKKWKIFFALACLITATFGMLGIWSISTDPLKNFGKNFSLISLIGAIEALCLYVFFLTLRFKIVLFSDRIEIQELVRTSMLFRQEIRGWKLLPSLPSFLVFTFKDPHRRPFKIAQLFRSDSDFEDWLYTLPSLDREAKQTSRAEIRNDQHLGGTPDERMKRVAQGGRLVKFSSAVALITFFWSLYPHPYKIIILILMAIPWLVVALVKGSQGVLRIDGNLNHSYPNLVRAFVLPGLALALRSFDYNLISSPALWWYSFVLGVILCLSALPIKFNARAKTGNLITVLIFSLVYGYGTVIQANALLDHSLETSYKAIVEEQRIVPGKTTEFQLILGPWGPKTESNTLRVNRATYHLIQRGDIVYLGLKQGALGGKWYFLRTWRHAGPVHRALEQ